MKSGYGKSLRLISLFLIVSFFGEQLAMAAQELRPVQVSAQERTIDLPYRFPVTIADIESSYKAAGASGMIYLLQDAHTNASGQRNLARALDLILSQEKDLKYVFSEAGEGDNSLSFLRATRPLSERQDLARKFVTRGLLHGTEYLDLTTERTFVLWGVEDPALYNEALTLYGEVASQRDRLENYLKRIESTALALRPRIASPALAEALDASARFHDEEASLTDHFASLSDLARALGLSLAQHPNLSTLKSLREKEAALDFGRANLEQMKALKTLSARDREEMEEVSRDHLASIAAAGQLAADAAFASLFKEKLGDSAGSYPELQKYFDYMDQARKIQAKGVIDELKVLEDEVLRTLARNEDERLFVRASAMLRLMKKLLHFTLTPSEYMEYQTLAADLGVESLTGFFNKKIMDLRSYHDRALLLEPDGARLFENAARFYSLTRDRDAHFIDRTLEKMSAEKQTKAVLVAGGFHSVNLKALLKERGVSYVSVVPQVLHETNLRRYEEILFGGPSAAIRPGAGGALVSQVMPRLLLSPQMSGSDEPLQAIRQIPATEAGREQLDSILGARLALSRPAVLGASGFIGQALAQALGKVAKYGQEPMLFVRDERSRNKMDSAPVGSDDVRFLELPDPAKIEALAKESGTIFHVANVSIAAEASRDPLKSLEVAMGTLRLVEAAGNKRIIRTTSELIYTAGMDGDTADETSVLTNFESGTPAGDWLDAAEQIFRARVKKYPNTHDSATLASDRKFLESFLLDNKIPESMKNRVYALENALEERFIKSSANGLNVRLSQVYGPGDFWAKARVPNLIRRFAGLKTENFPIWKDQPRRYIYIDDVVKILQALANLETLPQDRIVNVGSPEVFTGEQIVDILHDITNYIPVDLEFADAPESARSGAVPDQGRLQSLLVKMKLAGFRWTDMRTGLKRTVDWYRNKGLEEIRLEDLTDAISPEGALALKSMNAVPIAARKIPGTTQDDLPVGNASGVPTLLVTGAAGLIGGNTVRQFLETHPTYHVIILDNFTYAGPKESLIDILAGPHAARVKVYQGDVVDADRVGRLVERVDAIFHYAAESNVDLSYVDQGTFERTNIEGTRTIMEAAERENTRRHNMGKRPIRVIHFSTDEVYGDKPMDRSGYFKEDSPLNPTNPYAVTKQKAEEAVRQINERPGSNLGAIIVRMTNNYGPFKYPMNLLPNAVVHRLLGMPVPIFGSPNKKRDWLSSFDLARAADVIVHKGKPGSVYNVAGNHETTLIAAVKAVLDQMNPERLSEPELIRTGQIEILGDNREHNDEAYRVNDDLLRDQFQFENVVTFNSGVKQLVEWYVRNPEWILLVISTPEYKRYYEALYKNQPEKIREIERRIADTEAVYERARRFQALMDRRNGTAGARLADIPSYEIEAGLRYWRGEDITTPIKRPFRASRKEDVTDITQIPADEAFELERLAADSIRKGEGYLSLLIAGASSRMNTKEAPEEVRALVAGRDILSKAAVPIGVAPDGNVTTYLEEFGRNVARLLATVEKEATDAGLPSDVWRNDIGLMTNDEYRAEHDKLLADEGYYGLKAEQIRFFHQPLGPKFIAQPSRVEALRSTFKNDEAYRQALEYSKEVERRIASGETEAIILPRERDPLGHGEFFHQLIATGEILHIIDSGKRWIMTKNVDNYASKYDRTFLRIIGLFLRDQLDFQPEVSPRSPGQKGGSLIVMTDNDAHQLAEDPNIVATNKDRESRGEAPVMGPTDSYWFNDAVGVASIRYAIDPYKQPGQTDDAFVEELRAATPAQRQEIADRGRRKFPKIFDEKPAKSMNAVSAKGETNLWQSTGVVSTNMRIKAVGVRGIRNIPIEDYLKLSYEERKAMLGPMRFLSTKNWTKSEDEVLKAKQQMEKDLGREVTPNELWVTLETYQGNKIIADDLLRYNRDETLVTPGIFGARLSQTPAYARSLLEGVGENTPDWQRMNLLAQIILEEPADRTITLRDVLPKAYELFGSHGIEANDEKVIALMDRMVQLGLLRAAHSAFSLNVPKRLLATKMKNPYFIKDELEALVKPGREADLALAITEYAQASELFYEYPIESRWPFETAVMLMDKQERRALLIYLQNAGRDLRRHHLVDALLLHYEAEPPADWLQKNAPGLKGRTLYLVSPEIWLLSGGLGRVVQYLVARVMKLVRNDVKVVTIEPYYPYRINYKGEAERVDYTKLAEPVVDLSTVPVMEFDVPVGRTTVKAQVYRGRGRNGAEIYLIKDSNDYYTKLLYRYGPEFGTASWEEFSEFFSRAALMLMEALEEDNRAKAGDAYKAPIINLNDGQLGLLPVLKRMDDESEDKRKTALSRALVWFVTHTYRNRGIFSETMGRGYLQKSNIGRKWWTYFNRIGLIDYTSAGRRAADATSAVAAVHSFEVAPIDPTIKGQALTNGDYLEASGAAFDRIFQGDREEPAVSDIRAAKKAAKQAVTANERLIELEPEFRRLDPDKQVVGYFGRLVDEKAGLDRAFGSRGERNGRVDYANIRRLVSEGVQVILAANVQSHTQYLFDELKAYENALNAEGLPGRLFVVTGWSSPEQIALLAATDIQVQDSDRGTEAAGYTESNAKRNAALELTITGLEGILQNQGTIIDRQRPGIGDTLIPIEPTSDGYWQVFKWASDLYQSNPDHFASYQATALRTSGVLDAIHTAAENLRQYDQAMTRKEDPLPVLVRYIQGDPRAADHLLNEWFRKDLTEALRRSPDAAEIADTGHSDLKAFVFKNGDKERLVIIQVSRRESLGVQTFGTLRGNGPFKAFLESHAVQPNERLTVRDSFTGQTYDGYLLDHLQNGGLGVIVRDPGLQVLELTPEPQGARLAEDRSQTERYAVDWVIPTDEEIRTMNDRERSEAVRDLQLFIGQTVNDQKLFRTARTGEIGEAEVALRFSGSNTSVFVVRPQGAARAGATPVSVSLRRSTQDGFVVPDLTFDAQEVIRDGEDQVVVLKARDAQTMVAEMRQALSTQLKGALNLNTDRALLVHNSIAFFGDIVRDPTLLDLYLVQAASFSKQVYGKHMKHTFDQATEADWEIIDRRIGRLSDSYPQLRAALYEAFTRKASLEGHRDVNLITPGRIQTVPGNVYLSIEKPEPGDILLFPFMMAAVAGRTEGDKAHEDLILAVETALGRRIENVTEFEKMLFGNATADQMQRLTEKYKLPKILKLVLDEFVQGARLVMQATGRSA